MRSIVLKSTSRIIIPVLLLFSIFLLFRGHDMPGGGFAGGLTAALAIVLYAFANGVNNALKVMRFPPTIYFTLGLLIAFAGGFYAVLLGDPVFTGIWWDFDIPFLPKISTILVFDIGVYLLVIGTTTFVILTMIENY